LSIQKFILLLIGLTVILCAVYAGLISYFPLQRATYDVLIIPILFVITLLGYVFIVKAKSWDQAYFMPIILASIVVRLLIFAAINFIMIYSAPSDAVPNVILFFSIYFMYTLIETMSLFKLIQNGTN
jgi:hypothetical protein